MMHNLNKAQVEVSLPIKETTVKFKGANWMQNSWVNTAISMFYKQLLEAIEKTL